MNNLKFTAVLTVLLLIFSCQRAGDDARIEVDFLINNEELESLGFEYNEEDFSLYRNDPDKVYFTTIDEEVVFKDITIPISDNQRKWYLDNEEWKAEKLEVKNLPTFVHTFDTPGLYKVKLVVNDQQKVTKFVRVLDESESSKSLVAQKRSKAGQSNANSESQALFAQGKSRDKDDGDIGDFEVFDFSVSNSNPEKWEAIVFKDVSKTGEKITRRFWDFGDGTIIPTKGPKVKYSYANSGVYEVKMCVNMTNNCKRKRIIVSETITEKESLVAKADTPSESVAKVPETRNNDAIVERKAKRKSAAILQNLGFDLPSKVQAGLPVRMKDFSFPDDAINSRSWYIDGVKQFFYQRTVNYIFDTPGTYEIKMCLNKKKDQCVVKTINVYQNEVVEKQEKAKDNIALTSSKENKPFKREYIPIKSRPSKGFMCQSYGKAGLKSKYKCTTDRTFHYGNAIVNITPNLDVELQNAEIYGESDGYMDVMLLDESFTEIGRIKNVQVLPGYSTIEFADLAFTLQKGQKYSILLKPKSTKKKKIGLENANACRVPAYKNDDLNVEYQGSAFVMYDIKYCF